MLQIDQIAIAKSTQILLSVSNKQKIKAYVQSYLRYNESKTTNSLVSTYFACLATLFGNRILLYN